MAAVVAPASALSADMLPAAGATATLPPETDDGRYRQIVLRLTPGQSEDEVDRELAARAAALGIEATTSRPSTAGEPPTASTPSPASSAANHARTGSVESHDTTSTGATSQHSLSPGTICQDPTGTLLASRRRIKSPSFTHYEKYIAQVDPNLTQPKFLGLSSSRHERSLSSGSRTGYTTLKWGISDKLKWKRKAAPSPEVIVPCVCCRNDFGKRDQVLQTLPCGHTYCQSCVSVVVMQSTTDESKMPPRCCTQPIPGSIVKTVLSREEQHTFLKAVLQYSTPWESRIFCPNVSCGEFIPPRAKFDPKHPFEAVCRHCRTRVCVMCKRNAHRLGLDCPEDWELDAVLKMGEKSGWRRCYKCRTLVELTDGCTHMTCRCKAQFCYICGAVWDPAVGCPNFCNGEEELERRRMEEQERFLALLKHRETLEAEAEAARVAAAEADQRTAASREFQAVRKEQDEELHRFLGFESAARGALRERHALQKRVLASKYADLSDKMRERHAKTEQHLDDRQIEAEMDLRTALEQSERSIRIRLRHMEAYCNGIKPTAEGEEKENRTAKANGADKDNAAPPPLRRRVTQRQREELDQQYHIRDGMQRRHESQINVLREKQAKRMEELVERHGRELNALAAKREEDTEDLALVLTDEEEALAAAFAERAARLRHRWGVRAEVLRREMEAKNGGVRYGAMALPVWPSPDEKGGGSSPGAAIAADDNAPGGGQDVSSNVVNDAHLY